MSASSTVPAASTDGEASSMTQAFNLQKQTLGWDVTVLIPREVFWGKHQPWLEQRGYMLRPRYKPDWVPSWKDSDSHWDCEDGLISMRRQVLDATRISDGEMVMLKRISRTINPYEVELSKMFSEEPLKSDSRNHCVPVFEVLDVPDEKDISILVLPLLRKYNDPKLESVGEAVEYFRQMFEGLQFMHQWHVAHRDCMGLSIMMDPRPIYPEMYHPGCTYRTRDWKGIAKHDTRTARPVKYYFIDFGLSRMYHAENTSPLEVPIWGSDRTVPEFQDSDDLQNPFPTDIYYLGNMIREDFLQKTRRVEFMTPLIDDMVQADPNKRPTIHEVVERFDKLRCSLSSWTLMSRLIYIEDEECRSERFERGIRHLVRTTGHVVTHHSPLPRPPRIPQHTFNV